MRLHLAVVALILPALLHAQQADSLVTITGRVIDDGDSGTVAHATLYVAGTGVEGRTDGFGYYHLYKVPRGKREVVVRALGYARLTQSVDVFSPGELKLDFHLMRVPHELSQMVINGRSMRVPRSFEDVYRRGGLGEGVFITREQIDSLNPIDLKALLETVPGLYVNERGVYFQRCPVTFAPQLWIDGQRATRFRRISTGPGPIQDPYFFMELMNGVLPKQVQAIEVYRSNSETPAEFLDGSGCGVVAIWTLRSP